VLKKRKLLSAQAHNIKQAKWSVLKKRKSLSAQAHIIKNKENGGAEKEKVALCAGACNKNKKSAWCQKRERMSLCDCAGAYKKKRGKWSVLIRESCSSAGAH
jgi:hypothetical protein